MLPYKKLLLLLNTLILFACSTPDFKQLEQATIEIKGKVNVRNLNESRTANFTWLILDNEKNLFISNPLGQTELAIYSINKKHTAKFKDGKIVQADSAEALLLELTGWDLPLTLLESWLMGETPNNTGELNIDTQEPFRFKQDNWQVEFTRQQSFNSKSIPTKIKLYHDEQIITIVVKSYKNNA